MTAATVAAADRLHLEDLEIGRTVPFGRKEVTKDEIIAFATAYDPQLIHLDEDYAKTSIVGGLCASGFHSCAMLMRMVVDGMLANATSLGSHGVDEVKWIRPVRPGDLLTARYTCMGRRAFVSRPEAGNAKMLIEMLNQKGEAVVSWDTNQMLRRRHPGVPLPGADDGKPTSKPASKPEPLVSFWDMPQGPPPSRMGNFFEDRVVGEMDDIGRHTFTRDDIVGFARAYDPQPFHLDEAAGKDSLFGGLAASGWHTTAIYIRQSVAARRIIEKDITAAGGKLAVYGPSPGFKSLRWIAPVMVGDTIEFRNRTAAKIDLKSRPDRGLHIFETQGRNQHGRIVFAITGQMLCERREPWRPA